MGYDIHIIRAENTWEAENNPITVEEWLHVVDSDPEMERIEKLEGRNPITGEVITVPMQNSAVWHHEELNYKVPFCYSEGGISVARPDNIVIKKMKEIAIKLNAKVIGDDEEEY
ncbi:MAG: hypothetical protein ACOYWZ_05255 [Bacillota bacterium]